MSKVTYGKKMTPIAAMEVISFHKPRRKNVVGYNARGHGFFVTEGENSWEQFSPSYTFEYDSEVFAELSAISDEYSAAMIEFQARWNAAQDKLKKIERPA